MTVDSRNLNSAFLALRERSVDTNTLALAEMLVMLSKQLEQTDRRVLELQQEVARLRR